MKHLSLSVIATTIVSLGFSTVSQGALRSVIVCPGNSVEYSSNQEGTLKVNLSSTKTLVAKILPEGLENKIYNQSFGSGFEALNPNLGYKVSTEAISAMKSTLDLAASNMRAVTIYYDDATLVTVSKSESKGYQMWGITGPLSKAKSNTCL